MNHRSIRGSALLSGVVRVNLAEKVRFERNLEEDEGVHQVDSWGGGCCRQGGQLEQRTPRVCE